MHAPSRNVIPVALAARGEACNRSPAPGNAGREGAISLQDLSVVFCNRNIEVTAVKDVNIDIQPGQFVSLLGPSGCGKSTLLGTIGGMTRPSRGRVLIDDQPVREPG